MATLAPVDWISMVSTSDPGSDAVSRVLGTSVLVGKVSPNSVARTIELMAGTRIKIG